MRTFAHLHCHSQYSFLDGASSLEKLVKRAANLGMNCLAITDHNSVSAAVEFSELARAQGMKPIQGAEVTMEDGSHLTLLADGPQGYASLCTLLTRANLGSERLDPRVKFEHLAELNEGLVVLTGCARGRIPSLLERGLFDDALSEAMMLRDIFGRDRLFIELIPPVVPGGLRLCRRLIRLAEKAGLRTVATFNVHYAEKSDFPIHDILTCVRTKTTLDDVHPERRFNSENYLRSAEEAAEVFRDYPGALRTAWEIAEALSPALETGAKRFPKFETGPGQSSASYLRHLVFEGARQRYGRITREVEQRLLHELNIIEALGFCDYFLMVWDVARFARSKGIRYAGRGSAADSAVAYCLFITQVDSIARGLLFERFMSLERAQVPDIDIDFEAARRDEVTDYVYQKYGSDRVATVCTFNTFRLRSAVRDFGKALGFPDDEMDRFAKKLPHLPADYIEEALVRYPEVREADIPKWKYELLIRAAKATAGFPRFYGTHLGGVVVSKDPLTSITPLQFAAKGVITTQFDKNTIEGLGLIKLDLLCLRTLGAVETALGDIKAKAPEFDYDKIPLTDRDTYQMLNRGETVGVFQLESPAQRALQTRLGADNIEDIVASVALIRPGPIEGNMVEPFIARRLGLEEITYLHPKLKPILEKTYGVVLYQEQVIQIATEIAGFSPGESDKLRKVMTHFRSRAEMEEIGRHFVEKAMARGIDRATAETVLSYITGYAGYGFCEAHAAAFADTAYKTAYLIKHYPAEFYAAILSNQPMGFYPPNTLCVEARRRGIRILPPDVNKSEDRFTVEDVETSPSMAPFAAAVPESARDSQAQQPKANKAIRVSLRQVRGMTEELIARILKACKEQPFSSCMDFCIRCRPPRDILENLVLCGAFDSLHPNRRDLFWHLDAIVEAAHGALPDGSLGAGDSPKASSSSEANSLSAHTQHVLPLSYQVCDPMAGRDPKAVPDFTEAEKFKFEYSVLSLTTEKHFMDFFRPRLKRMGVLTSAQLKEAEPGSIVAVAGITVRPHRPPTKSGRTVVFLSLEDECGLSEVTVFENVYQRFGSLIFGAPGLIVRGKCEKRGDGVSVTAQFIRSLTDRRS